VPSGTASLSDSVRFTAFRPHSSHPNVAFGLYQIRHGEAIVMAGKLVPDRSADNSYDMYYVDVQWNGSSLQYLGKNTIQFITAQGSNSGEFILTK
jgi:hypothetical protein